MDIQEAIRDLDNYTAALNSEYDSESSSPTLSQSSNQQARYRHPLQPAVASLVCSHFCYSWSVLRIVLILKMKNNSYRLFKILNVLY